MAVLLNAKLVDGQLYTIEWCGERFTRVEPQAAVVNVADAGSLADLACCDVDQIVDARGAAIVPAMLDVHVHSRDPGLTHKETWSTLARAAAKGGVVGVVDMPNTLPPMLTAADVRQKADIASSSSLAYRFLLGVDARNINSLRHTLDDKSLPLAGLKIFFGRSTGNLMFDDLDALARALGESSDALLVFHSEDQCGIDHNLANIDATAFGSGNASFRLHTALRSSQTAYTSTKKILEWAVQRQYRVHIAHLSTPREVELIEDAKARGGRITSEVAPHHLLLCEDDYDRLGPLLKVNPPVRARDEMRQMLRYFAAGAIELFATDHAPHTLQEKFADYKSCPSGMPSLDFFLPLLAECAAKSGLPWLQAVDTATTTPADLYGFADYGRIAVGAFANFVWLLPEPLPVSEKEVLSKCGWTPYHGHKLPVTVAATWHRGRNVYARRLGPRLES